MKYGVSAFPAMNGTKATCAEENIISEAALSHTHCLIHLPSQ